MPEKTRSSISREAFNGISRLFGENSNVLSEEGFIDCCVIGDLMFDYSYNGLPFDWFGVNQEGQTDVVERIMNGMGEASRREHEKYIREYASHAADLLADNILNSGRVRRKVPKNPRRASEYLWTQTAHQFPIQAPMVDFVGFSGGPTEEMVSQKRS